MNSGKYAFCAPAALIRASISASIRSQMRVPGRADHHGAADRAVVGQLGLGDHILVPAGEVLRLRGEHGCHEDRCYGEPGDGRSRRTRHRGGVVALSRATPRMARKDLHSAALSEWTTCRNAAAARFRCRFFRPERQQSLCRLGNKASAEAATRCR